MSTVQEVNVGSVCRSVLEYVEQVLKDCGRAPVQSYVAAGAIAWDDCCGLLVVAPERVYRTARFPQEGPDARGCYDGLIAVSIIVLLLRCVPVLDDKGQPPPVSELDAAYNDALIDASVIWDALASIQSYETASQEQQFVGAQGGCIGIESRIILGVDGETWCGPCTPTP